MSNDTKGIAIREVDVTNEDGEVSTHWVRAELAEVDTAVKVGGNPGTVTRVGDQELDADTVGVKAAQLDEVKADKPPTPPGGKSS